ncbi:MAG: UDP-N-acetylmuramoyl-L-alanine--D-glutamate ligase, partial [Bacteroidales bacterium]|nr:UDP-N-acetylmuramoyl-L-alanine--D-glutamate ligase [Bacteroidales bacterium]
MDTNNIIVLGAGESGVGAAVLARKKGLDVFVSDNNKIKGKYKNVLSQFDIEFEEGKHSEKRILKAFEVIKSPGIPDEAALI